MTSTSRAFSRHPFRASARRRAFTLIEVLMVIALIALLFGVLIFGSGMLGSSRLRSAAGLLISGVRVSIARANTTGRPVRMVFDLDNDTLSIEESSDKMLRVKDTEDKDSEGTSAGAEAATEAEREATEYADGIVKGPRAPRAKFTPIPQLLQGSDEEAGSAARGLGIGIGYHQMQTEHDSRPRAEGRAYLYFWPGGGTERAAIQLTRSGDEEGITVLVSPLTGRARIVRGRVELEEPKYGEAFGVREEE